MNLQSMSASRFVAAFLDEVNKWEKGLSLCGEVIDIWMRVQQLWMYLESIFIGSEDIRIQLPEEAKAFDRIDDSWQKIMSETFATPNVMLACGVDGRLDELHGLMDALTACQKGLADYLQTKRNAFPRFYFISDDELLSVLAPPPTPACLLHRPALLACLLRRPALCLLYRPAPCLLHRPLPAPCLLHRPLTLVPPAGAGLLRPHVRAGAHAQALRQRGEFDLHRGRHQDRGHEELRG